MPDNVRKITTALSSYADKAKQDAIERVNSDAEAILGVMRDLYDVNDAAPVIAVKTTEPTGAPGVWVTEMMRSQDQIPEKRGILSIIRRKKQEKTFKIAQAGSFEAIDRENKNVIVRAQRAATWFRFIAQTGPMMR